MSGEILTVSPSLPVPPGTTSNDASNPKSTIKGLRMTTAQSNADAQYDPPPKREGFQSYTTYHRSILYFLMVFVLLYFVCRKCTFYTFILFGVGIALIYLERNLNRTV